MMSKMIIMFENYNIIKLLTVFTLLTITAGMWGRNRQPKTEPDQKKETEVAVDTALQQSHAPEILTNTEPEQNVIEQSKPTPLDSLQALYDAQSIQLQSALNRENALQSRLEAKEKDINALTEETKLLQAKLVQSAAQALFVPYDESLVKYFGINMLKDQVNIDDTKRKQILDKLTNYRSDIDTLIVFTNGAIKEINNQMALPHRQAAAKNMLVKLKATPVYRRYSENGVIANKSYFVSKIILKIEANLNKVIAGSVARKDTASTLEKPLEPAKTALKEVGEEGKEEDFKDIKDKLTLE